MIRSKRVNRDKQKFNRLNHGEEKSVECFFGQRSFESYL